MIKKTIFKLSKTPMTYAAKKFIKNLVDGDYLIGDVPYQCQFASPGLAKDILEKKIKAEDDPNWRVFGFKTKQEAAYWAWRDCAICCIKMILDFTQQKVTIAKLTKKGLELGGYDVKKDHGWFHKPLIELLRLYGFKSHGVLHLGVNELAKNIYNKKFVIASVNPATIRQEQPLRPKVKSGHLVLVIGFRIKDGKLAGFFINNPSGKSFFTQKQAFIPIDIFVGSYGQRGIVINQN